MLKIKLDTQNFGWLKIKDKNQNQIIYLYQKAFLDNNFQT